MVVNQVKATKIVVMTGGSLEPALDYIAAAFEKESGHKVTISYLHDLEFADLVLLNEEALERSFRHTGRIEQGEIFIGRSPGLGAAVRKGAKVPDISTAEALIQSLLDAERVLMTEKHTSSLHLESVLRERGVYEKIEPKIRRAPIGPRLIDLLLAGEGDEVMLLPVNAIRASKDPQLVYLGPLPEGFQKNSRFFAAPMPTSANKELAWEFARYCGGPGRATLLSFGFT